MEDWQLWFFLVSFDFALIAGLVFRSRQCAAIVMPFPIIGLFLVLPKVWWWVPAIGAVAWLMALCTFRLWGIDANIKANARLFLMFMIPAAPLAVWIGTFFGTERIWAGIFMGILGLLTVGSLLFFVTLYLVCPLLVRKRYVCEGFATCYSYVQGHGRYQRTVRNVGFRNDPSTYRVRWWAYRQLEMSIVAYEKCVCPLGVSWIRRIK